MEFILNRYRNLTVLLVVIAAQLLLIAYQVRTNKDVPLLRVWAVTAVTPIERVLEVVRRNTWGFVEDYFVLLNTRQQNDKLAKEVGRLKLENQYLRTELSTADRAHALSQFQEKSPSKMIAASIIGNGTGANSKAVFVDRGSGNGVESGMAVVTPDGIVGKVVAAYPTASLVLLITDANFAAGVISQKNRVRGTLKGQGHDGTVQVDYVQTEEKVDPGEWFYTSGDDRIFPKGFPVGQATTVRNGRNLKEIFVTPSGFQNGLEEVLIVLDAAHQPIPDTEVATQQIKLTPAPPEAPGAAAANQASTALATDADRLKEQYRQAGDAQHHTFGEGAPGSIPPDFTKLPGLRDAGQKPSAPTTAGVRSPNGATAASATVPNANPPAAAAQSNTRPPVSPAVAGAKPSSTAALPNAKSPVTAGAPPVAKPPISPAVANTRNPADTRSGITTAKTADVSATTPAKPKSPAPILVTDPTDADPSAPVILPSNHRSDTELDEYGQPKTPKPVARKKPVVVDGNREILPPAPAPKPKANAR